MNKMMMGLVLLLSGGAALAHEQAGDGGQRFEHRGERVAAKLGLDADQTAKLRATFTKFRAQAMPVHQDARATMQALRDLARNGSGDAAKVTQLTEQLGRDRQQLRTINEARQAELRQLLTPEQYAALTALRQERHERRGHHFDKRAE